MMPLPEPDLAHAVTRCQAGDKQSFRLIVDAHSERLYGIAYLVADDRTRAEDAVQEALFLAWKNIKRLRKGAKLGPWLNRILLNQIKKQGRRARHPETEIDEALGLQGNDRSPAQHAIDSEVSAHLWDRVGALPEEQRIALVLKYYLGYTISEISQSTGWHEGTVKSRLHRGIAALRSTVDMSTVSGEAEGTVTA